MMDSKSMRMVFVSKQAPNTLIKTMFTIVLENKFLITHGKAIIVVYLLMDKQELANLIQW